MHLGLPGGVKRFRVVWARPGLGSRKASMVEYVSSFRSQIVLGCRLRRAARVSEQHAILRIAILTFLASGFSSGGGQINTQTNKQMSRRGQHHSRMSSLASLASASSATDTWVDPEHPPYQQPWLNCLVQLFISLHNALVIPVISAFTSALYTAISQLFGRPKYPAPDPSNGAIVVLNSTGGTFSWLSTHHPGCRKQLRFSTVGFLLSYR